MASVGRKASLILTSQVAGAGLGYLILLAIGRYFEAAAFGAYTYALGALGLLAVLSNLGYGEAHVHFLARGVPVERALGVYARVRVGLTILLALLACIAALVWLEVLDKPLTDTTLPILAAALGLHLLSSIRQVTFDTWLGGERVNRAELAKGFDTLLSLVFVAAMGLALAASLGRWTPTGPVATWLADTFRLDHPWSTAEAGLALALGFLLAKALSFLPVAWWWIRDRVHVGPWDRELAGQYTQYAIPIALASAVGLLQPYTDVVMVGFFWNDTEVGLYGMAQRVSGLALLASVAVATPLLPRFSALVQAGRLDDARRTLQDSERYLLLLTVPAAVGLTVLAGPALHIAIGDKYLGSAAPLQLLAPWAILVTALTPARMMLLGAGRTRATMVAGFIAVGLNAVLNLWFIPAWGLGLGATGAALGTLLSTVVAAVYIRWRLRAEFAVPLADPVLFRMTFAAVGTGLFWWAALEWAPATFARFWQLALWGAAGCAVFALLAAGLGLLHRGDFAVFRRLASPRGLWRELGGKK